MIGENRSLISFSIVSLMLTDRGGERAPSQRGCAADWPGGGTVLHALKSVISFKSGRHFFFLKQLFKFGGFDYLCRHFQSRSPFPYAFFWTQSLFLWLYPTQSVTCSFAYYCFIYYFIQFVCFSYYVHVFFYYFRFYSECAKADEK